MAPGTDTNTTDSIKWEKPPLHSLLNLYDFEDVARRTFPAKAFAFYPSAATDLVTHQANSALYQRIFLRPRVLRDVRHIDLRSSILGQPLELPIFVSPAAMAGLAHPDGECALTRACAAAGIAQIVSAHASHPLEEIVAACYPSTPPPIFFQLYVNSDRAQADALLRRVAVLTSVRGLILTVDAPVAGKREADERVAAQGDETSALTGATTGASGDKLGGGLGRLMGRYVDQNVTWDDLPWIRKATGGRLPIVLKGIQTAIDARMAVKAGAAGIIVSNHGGRTIDTAQPAILTLLEIRRHAPEVFEKVEVYVDGGIRRGTDILKALAIGARAVGIGRPALYSLAYGSEGAQHMIHSEDFLHSSPKVC